VERHEHTQQRLLRPGCVRPQSRPCPLYQLQQHRRRPALGHVVQWRRWASSCTNVVGACGERGGIASCEAFCALDLNPRIATVNRLVRPVCHPTTCSSFSASTISGRVSTQNNPVGVRYHF
jgi:hypothetical protein